MPTRRIAVMGLLLALGVLASAAKCIENDQMFVDTEGYTHVIGNMTNETDVSASTVTLSAKLFDANDNVIAEATGPLCPESVQPHSQNVFDLRFPNPNIAGAVRYEVRPIAGVTLPSALPDSKIFLIRFVASRVGPGVVVVGQVRNDSQATYSHTALCAAVFNNKGKVIRSLSKPITGDLTPGQALIFTGGLPDVPAEGVQFRLWFTSGAATQWVSSDKVTIQN
jgi:hypothetical protein